MVAEDPAARDRMAWVSLSGGMALTNAGLGAVHGLAGVLGGLTTAPHGLICGRLIGPVLRANRDRAADETAARLDRVFATVADQLGGPPDRAPETLSAWVSAQGLPPLRSFGPGLADPGFVAAKALVSSSMRDNPVALSADELAEVLVAESRLP